MIKILLWSNAKMHFWFESFHIIHTIIIKYNCKWISVKDIYIYIYIHKTESDYDTSWRTSDESKSE